MRYALLLLLLIVAPAQAQVSYPPGASASEVQAAQAAAQQALAAIPQPGNSVGSAEMVGGRVGASTAYKRDDWVPPRISRTGSCTLTALGTCTATWMCIATASACPFPAGTTPFMLGDPVAINANPNFPIECNVVGAPTISSVPVKCWVGQSSIIAALGGTVAPWAILSGTTVTVAGLPSS